MRAVCSIALSSILLTLVACGTADPNGSKYASGDPKLGDGKKDTGGENGLGGDKGGKPAPNFDACATATAGADAKPVYLVFAYDQSGSMKDNGKWDAAKSAMKSFFSSPDSQGIHASLGFFPLGNNNTFCNTSLYSTPEVPITALPSTDFGDALDSTGPNGPTPTASALAGAIKYAQSIQGTTAKDGTVAVVMVTDGIPQGCNDDNDPSVAANEASAISTSIKTYVVGVGDQLSSLDSIAKSGGTSAATRVSVGDPVKTQQDLTKAIGAIKASALSCDYGIPAAPNGQTLDPAKVNVQYTPSGGSPSALQHNQSCNGGTGWKYDDENNPKRILVCDGSCDQIKSQSGKVDVVFGCATVNAGVQ